MDLEMINEFDIKKSMPSIIRRTFTLLSNKMGFGRFRLSLNPSLNFIAIFTLSMGSTVIHACWCLFVKSIGACLAAAVCVATVTCLTMASCATMSGFRPHTLASLAAHPTFLALAFSHMPR